MPVRCGWCSRDDLNLDPPKQTSVKYISTEWMILRAHPMPPFFWKRPWSYDPQPIWSLSSNKVACQQSDEFRSLVSKHQRGCRFDKFAVPQYRPQNWHRPCQIDPNRGFEDSFPLEDRRFSRSNCESGGCSPAQVLADSGWLGLTRGLAKVPVRCPGTPWLSLRKWSTIYSGSSTSMSVYGRMPLGICACSKLIKIYQYKFIYLYLIYT